MTSSLIWTVLLCIAATAWWGYGTSVVVSDIDLHRRLPRPIRAIGSVRLRRDYEPLAKWQALLNLVFVAVGPIALSMRLADPLNTPLESALVGFTLVVSVLWTVWLIVVLLRASPTT